jgi:hypothetical protein
MKTGRSSHVLDLRNQAPEPAATPEAVSEPEVAPKAPQKKPRLVPRIIRLAVVLIAAAGFLLLNSVPLPERLIGVYFVVSMVYAFDSQRTFIVALIFLVLVAAASAAGQSVPAQNYAVYAFYFLVIGLVAAIREQISNRLETDRGNSQL